MEPDFDKICFVIMPFGKEGSTEREQFDDTYENIIKKAVEESGLGLKCVRADEITRPGSIIDDIIRYAIKSKCVIADMTGKNPNVFYELGIRHSFSGRTILLAQSSNDLPFDVGPQRTIMYSNSTSAEAEKAEKKLIEFLVEMDRESSISNSPVLNQLSVSDRERWIGGKMKERVEFREKLVESASHHALKFSQLVKDHEYLVETLIVPQYPDSPLVELHHFYECLNQSLARSRSEVNALFNLHEAGHEGDAIWVYQEIPDNNHRYYFEFNRYGLCLVRQYLSKEFDTGSNQVYVPLLQVAACVFLGLMVGVHFLEKCGFGRSVVVRGLLHNIGESYLRVSNDYRGRGYSEGWSNLVQKSCPFETMWKDNQYRKALRESVMDFLCTILFSFGVKYNVANFARGVYQTMLRGLMINLSPDFAVDGIAEMDKT